MGTYFTASTYDVTDGNIVYASDLDNPFTALESSIDSLVGDIRTGDGLKYGADTGSANTYVMDLDPAITSYTDGLEIWLKPANTNTGASTLNVNSLGAKAIKRFGLSSVEAGDLLANFYVHLKYDGNYFQIVSTAGAAEASAASSATAAAASAVAAADSETAAAASAAEINLPTISGSTALDGIRVNTGKTGYEFVQFYTETEVDALLAALAIGAPVVSGVMYQGGIHGLDLEYVDADDLLFRKGGCIDSTGSVEITLSTNMTKEIDEVWVAGDTNGGYVGDAPAANEFRYAFVIMKADETTDVCIDSDPDCANIPSGYTYYRFLGPVFFNSTPDIIPFTQSGKVFSFMRAGSTYAVIIASSLTTTYTQYDASAILPEQYIEAIQYATVYGFADRYTLASQDGTNESFYVGRGPSVNGWGDVTAGQIWGGPGHRQAPIVPYNDGDYYFKSDYAGHKLGVETLILKR